MNATSVIKLCCKLCCEKWVNSSVIPLFTVFFRTAWTKIDQDPRSSTVLNCTRRSDRCHVRNMSPPLPRVLLVHLGVDSNCFSFPWVSWNQSLVRNYSSFSFCVLSFIFYFYIRKTLVLDVMVMVAPRRSLKTHLIQ